MTPTPAPRDEFGTFEKWHKESGAELLKASPSAARHFEALKPALYECWSRRAALAEAELAEVRQENADLIEARDSRVAERLAALDALAKERDELRAKVAELEADEPAWDAMMTKLEDDNTELRAELERVKKDSERLQFLIDNRAYVETGLHGSWLHFLNDDSWQVESYEDGRAAIDAAIVANKGLKP